MTNYGEYVRSFTQAKQKAKTFVDQITTSSRFGVEPDAATRLFLKPTVRAAFASDQNATLYRGLNLNHLDSSAKDAVKALQVGFSVPQEYRVPNTGQILIHTTTDKAVAEKYAGDGCCMVIEMTVPWDDIICSTAYLRTVFGEEEYTPEDWDYFDNESEVLVDKNSNFAATIIKVQA